MSASPLAERLSANLSTLFPTLPMKEALVAARHAGFRAIEIQYPYDIPAITLYDMLAETGMSLVLINAWPGNRNAGSRGLACLEHHQSQFRNSIDEAIAYASVVGCLQIHVLCGRVETSNDRSAALECAAANLAWATNRADAAGITILIEAINQIDVPGYLLRSVDEAATLIAQIGNLTATKLTPKLLLDTYHAAMNGEDTLTILSRYRALIAHSQVADAPQRGAPGTGNIDWPSVFSALHACSGWIGCEYIGTGHPKNDFSWISTTLPDWLHESGF